MPENITVREVKKEDNFRLAGLIREVFDEHNAPRQGKVFSDPATDNLSDLFNRDDSLLLVAEVEGQICGCCGIYPTEGLDNDTAELVKYYLHKDFRGMGIGRTLMEKCIEAAKLMGYQKLYIESMPEFSNAVRIYEKQGFRNIGHPLGNSGHTSCSIWMIRDL